MKLGERYSSPLRGAMMRAKNGALYVLNLHNDTLWVKEQGAPSEPPSYGWRTCVAGGVEGIPLPTLVGLAPFTVVAILHGTETPADLARCERYARRVGEPGHFLDEQEITGWESIAGLHQQAVEKLGLSFNRAELLAFLNCERQAIVPATIEKFELLAALELAQESNGLFATYYKGCRVHLNAGTKCVDQFLCDSVILLHSAGVRHGMTADEVSRHLAAR